jgi:hypothetical protein
MANLPFVKILKEELFGMVAHAMCLFAVSDSLPHGIHVEQCLSQGFAQVVVLLNQIVVQFSQFSDMLHEKPQLLISLSLSLSLSLSRENPASAWKAF